MVAIIHYINELMSNNHEEKMLPLFLFRKSDDANKEVKAKVCESNPTKPKRPFCNEIEEAMSGGTNKVNMLYSW